MSPIINQVRRLTSKEPLWSSNISSIFPRELKNPDYGIRLRMQDIARGTKPGSFLTSWLIQRSHRPGPQSTSRKECAVGNLRPAYAKEPEHPGKPPMSSELHPSHSVLLRSTNPIRTSLLQPRGRSVSKCGVPLSRQAGACSACSCCTPAHSDSRWALGRRSTQKRCQRSQCIRTRSSWPWRSWCR